MPLLSKLDPANAGNWKRLGGLSSFGALMLLLGRRGVKSWARYAQAFVISLLENDPDNPGRLRLHWERTHSDGSPLLRAEGGMEAAALQARDFANLRCAASLVRRLRPSWTGRVEKSLAGISAAW